MRKKLATVVVIAVVGVILYLPSGCKKSTNDQPAAKSELLAQPNACTMPTQMASTPEQTAWQLFVAATCPVNGDKYPYVTWENWIEQNQLYNPQGQNQAFVQGVRPRFHMSPLARIMRERLAKRSSRAEVLLPQAANESCNSQTWSGRTICEEARLNSDAQNYVTSNGLTTLNGQVQFISAGKTFQFTPPSIEIKADWIQLPSCNNLPANVHVETINNVCYALGGIHLISKLVDKWIWATFEPQNQTTNSQRCVVLGCNDPWGSVPAQSSGQSTALSQPLSQLISNAGLAPEWKNYRLDGVQVDFLNSNGQPSVLGNSIIEGDNAGNPTLMKSSSCITCHNFSTINKSKQSLSPDFIIGTPKPYPPGYVGRDFVWSLALAH
jgi:hypothetical protein